MGRFLLFLPLTTAVIVGATHALAQPDDYSHRLHTPASIGFKHAYYSAATGELTPMPPGAMRGGPRIGNLLYSCSSGTPYFFPAGNCLQTDPQFGQVDELLFDWMDIPYRFEVGGFQFSYGTDAPTDPNAVRMTILFQNDANGYGDNTGDIVAGFEFNLPGRPPGWPYAFVGWTITVNLDLVPHLTFEYGNDDLDEDGRPDTGFYLGFLGPQGYGESTYTGVFAGAEPNNPLMCVGAEDAFDRYIHDPNEPCADPNAAFIYDATFSFGGPPAPLAQFFFRLYDRATAGCNLPGCEDGDLDGDCRVNLADLSQMLQAFGCCEPSACYDEEADVHGDGCIHLSDLSALLEEYGTNCN